MRSTSLHTAYSAHAWSRIAHLQFERRPEVARLGLREVVVHRLGMDHHRVEQREQLGAAGQGEGYVFHGRQFCPVEPLNLSQMIGARL